MEAIKEIFSLIQRLEHVMWIVLLFLGPVGYFICEVVICYFMEKKSWLGFSMEEQDERKVHQEIS